MILKNSMRLSQSQEMRQSAKNSDFLCGRVDYVSVAIAAKNARVLVKEEHKPDFGHYPQNPSG